MKVVVLAGPESSGKSWLAGEIATRFGGQVVGSTCASSSTSSSATPATPTSL